MFFKKKKVLTSVAVFITVAILKNPYDFFLLDQQQKNKDREKRGIAGICLKASGKRKTEELHDGVFVISDTHILPLPRAV